MFCRFYIFYSKIFGTVAVAVAVVYGVDFVRKVLLPFVWKKKDLGNNNRSENDNSDSEDTHQWFLGLWLTSLTQGEELGNELISRDTSNLCLGKS